MNNVKEDAPQPSYYDVLRISPRDDDINLGTLRAAYRSLLLEHHPDKSKLNEQRPKLGNKDQEQYSIDLITRAYQTLSDRSQRAQYDKELANRKQGQDRATAQNQYASFGSFDLEDLEFDGSHTWSLACRCGLEKGYTLTEDDLEKEAELGEIYVGCHGCSLSIKVSFSTAGPDDPIP